MSDDGLGQLIALRRGGGAVRDLGEAFQPDLHRPRTEDAFRIVWPRGDGQDYWEILRRDWLRSTFGIPRPTHAADTWRDPNVIADQQAEADRRARLGAERTDVPADLDPIQLCNLTPLAVCSEQNRPEAEPPPQFPVELLRLVLLLGSVADRPRWPD